MPTTRAESRKPDSKKPEAKMEKEEPTALEYLEQQLNTDLYRKTTFSYGNKHHKYGATFIPRYTAPRTGLSLGRREFVTPGGDPFTINVWGAIVRNKRGSMLKATGQFLQG